MIKKNKVKRRGKELTWVGVVEGYRAKPGAAPKQRTIKSFGYLEDQADPEGFMEEVERYDAEYRGRKEPLRIEAALTAVMYNGENRKYNYGYKYLEAVYKMMGIEEFIKERVKAVKFRGKYSPGEIFKFLVIQRLMNPDSKRATFQMKEGYYGMETEYELADVYRSLDVFSGFEIEIQRHLNERVKRTIGRDLSHAFYDVTNYYFEIDYPEGEEDLRKNGVSKEHRVDPITAMGLFIDSNSIPVSMSIFPGNTSDSLTLEPTMKDIKKSYGLGRLVVVADKGLNSSKNIDKVVNNGDGYVFSQIVRGTKGQRYHDQLFEVENWVRNKEGSYRYKLFEEEYIGKDVDGKNVTRKRKVLLYWNKAEAEKARRKRDEKLKKAARSVKNNAYSIKKGVDEYTKENIVDKTTGELLEDIAKCRTVDTQKAEVDALYDGYFCIITSELEYDERKIREVYGGLWKIEQSFRIMKSDLYARPVFVKTNAHIRAHFLICFVALLIVRIIQHKMGAKPLSAERIARVLNAATCRVYKGGIVHLDDVGGLIAFKKRLDKHDNLVDTLLFSHDDEIALDFKSIQSLFGTDFFNIFHRIESFNKSLNSIALP